MATPNSSSNRFCGRMYTANKQGYNYVISDGYSSIAVIAKNKEEVKMIHKSLSKSMNCNLVWVPIQPFHMDYCNAFIPSKGLEFDAVFVLNLMILRCRKKEVNLFYTVCSRDYTDLYIYSLNTLMSI